MNAINPLTGVSPAGTALPRQGERTAQEQFAQPGQFLKALVLEAKTDNRFIIEIGANRLLAQSNAPLAPGQTLQLQVMKTAPQVELKIVSDTLNQFLGRSLTLIGKNIDITALFQSLQQVPSTLETLTPSTRNVLSSYFSLQQAPLEGEESGVILKQLIDRLGLSLEKILSTGDKEAAGNTLKAALLEIGQSFKGAETIAEQSNRILATIELFQLAQVHMDGNKQFLFPLPLPFVNQGFLQIENNPQQDKQGDYADNEARFSLHLTMSDIGHLRVDFYHTREGLYVRFHTESQEKTDFVSQFSEDLKSAISEAPLLSLTFANDATDPVGDLMRQIVPEGTSILDTKA
jgi:hypothetical protein